ncbi:MAG: TolC family outer membrane protein [Poseidonibacter sp.]|uniref:TolC family outer membrane protein n=1 Tax=Poseidonibacter sp. TaxID=2321188 RepID=UPI00359E058C
MKNIACSLFLLSVVSTLNLQAMTLNKVLDDVLTTNPVVLERLKNYDKTVYDLKISKSEYAPSIDFISSIGYERTLEKHTTTPFEAEGYHIYRNTLSVTQNLFNGFGTRNRVNYEQARVMAAAYNYVEKTNDVAFNVVREYINVLKYYDLYTLEKENIALTRDILNKTKELSDSGSGAFSDVKKVDSSLQLAEFNFLTHQNNLMDAEFSLGKLLGRRINHSELTLPKFEFLLPQSMDEAASHAIDANPSLLVTDYNITASKAALAQSKSKFSPTLDFQFEYNLDKNTSAEPGHSRSYSALLVFKQNLYRGNANVNEVKQNKINVMQEFENQREIKRQIIEGLQLSWSAYVMIEKQLGFLKSYEKESKATLDLYTQEFEDGSRTLIDLLTAQDDYISARNKYIVASHDWLFSKYRILDSMGELINSLFGKDSAKFYAPTTADYKVVTNDPYPIYEDRDRDEVHNRVDDLCDNSLLGLSVDIYGCKNEVKEAIFSPVVESKIEVAPSKEYFEEEFLSATSGYTLNLATYSSQVGVDRFVKKYNIEDNYVSFAYLTPIFKREYIKIIGLKVYKTKEEAYKALAKFPKSLDVHRPYISDVFVTQQLYKSYN